MNTKGQNQHHDDGKRKPKQVRQNPVEKKERILPCQNTVKIFTKRPHFDRLILNRLRFDRRGRFFPMTKPIHRIANLTTSPNQRAADHSGKQRQFLRRPRKPFRSFFRKKRLPKEP